MFRELVNELITLLKTNIPDPNTERANAGEMWIYPDFPETPAKMPRISIVFVGSSEAEFYAINGGMTLVYPLRYEISAWIRMKQKHVINSEEFAGGKLLDYLADQIINTIESNAFSISNVIVGKLAGGGSITIVEDNTGIMRKPLEFIFYYQKQAGA
jgi:hypothetical protein